MRGHDYTVTDSTTDGPIFSAVSMKSQVRRDVFQHELSKYSFTELYSENVLAKIIRIAIDGLAIHESPSLYPETVPQSGPDQGHYQYREVDFWTSGFFPGSIYSLIERCIKFPGSIDIKSTNVSQQSILQKLEQLGHTWSEPLHRQALRTDTHDLGFQIMPAMRPRWELFHDHEALATIKTAANSLYQRYDSRLQAIRSWDTFNWHQGVNITCMKDNFLVIIDSMCNMELLFYAAAHSGDKTLADAAVAHARTVLRTHLRPEEVTREGFTGTVYSTAHLVNLSPSTGLARAVVTAQGYSDQSTWSRGQAWAILGYAQTFQWSGEPEFLDAACGLVEYFLLRLEQAPECVEVTTTAGSGSPIGRYVPLWDFDAPIVDPKNPLRDTSAGVIAANGMLILSQALMSRGKHELSAKYFEASLRIVQDTLDLALSGERMQLAGTPTGDLAIQDVESGKRFDAILKHATVCNNAFSFPANTASDHGLVYADYYLIEFGTRLLRWRAL